MPHPVRTAARALLLVSAAACPAAAQDAAVSAALHASVAAAEENLKTGELQIAESRYRTALLQGWMIVGSLAVSEGRLADARQAFERAAASAVENGAALQALALVQLHAGDHTQALATLTKMAGAAPRNPQLRLALAQALVSAGRPEEAVQELEEAHAMAPDDPQLAFALGSGYLRVKKIDAAERQFAAVAAARPIPETHVLIGRTYRDFGHYERARTALRQALKIDPRTRRAHYYLGTIAVLEEGVVRVDEAIAEFRKELAVAPDDPPTLLRLGMALVEARRYDEALPPLERAVKMAAAAPEAWFYLGRCHLGLGRAADAVVSLKRALEVGPAAAATARAADRLRSIHYQLALALRATGAADEAARAFAEAERLSARRAEASRQELADYMADVQDAPASSEAALSLVMSGYEKLTAADRARIARDARENLARSYLNLGIMHAQASRFARAAELFEGAVTADPAFPQAQYSLGVAYFNAGVYESAAAALARALEQQPGDAGIRRMLAVAALNAEDFVTAADLLRDDPRRASDPSLQYAYGLALVQSGRAEEAERTFSRILAEHPDVPELNVVLGQAYAAQGDYESAVKHLQRARELKADVAEASAGLGLIYLQQGRLDDAAAALRAELRTRPSDTRSRYTLATVLDLDGRTDEAMVELRAILAAQPSNAKARYLVGKILLARGDAADALQHLELAARLAPGDANVRYQLGQAYQRAGQAELAEREFEAYRKLKDRKRGGLP